MKAQVLLSKRIAATYYAREPDYNYWNGCSTGGRQGYVLAQELGRELDGILANAPAMYWTRFQTAQMWGQIVMKDLTGGPIAAAKLNQATASAVAACDGADGVIDGVIDEPRACTFSAKANICGAPTAPAANCLDAAEAEAIDRIWDGPRNPDGKRIWFGLDRGTAINALNGTAPFFLGVTQFHWDTHDRTFDWTTVTMNTYADVAQQGSRNIADVTDTFDDLDTFRASGGKLLTFVGANDQLIMPQGVLHYYRQMAQRYGRPHDDDFSGVQKFYRAVPRARRGPLRRWRGPAATGPVRRAGQLGGEQGAAADHHGHRHAPAARSRARGRCARTRRPPIYNGSGSTDDAANFQVRRQPRDARRGVRQRAGEVQARGQRPARLPRRWHLGRRVPRPRTRPWRQGRLKGRRFGASTARWPMRTPRRGRRGVVGPCWRPASLRRWAQPHHVTPTTPTPRPRARSRISASTGGSDRSSRRTSTSIK